MFSSTNGSPTKGYLPSPAGMLMGDSFDRRKSTAKWAAAERNVSIGQMVVGLLVLILSLKYLYQFTETTGLFLGGLLIASGALGYAGGARKSSSLINLQLVASIIGVVLAFQFVGEVVRDAQVDCALAELYQRGKATERAVDEARQNEVMHAVFSRLNELEDSLSEAQSGASHHAELRREQQALRNTDLNYIRAKVDMVKRHAEEVLASVLKNESINADTVAVMSEEEKASLRRRLDTADKVIERVSKAHGGEGDLTYEEYREVLAALTDAATVPDKAAHPELQQALKELPNMQAALQRKKADTYETLLVGAPGARVQRLQEQRRVRRDAWSEQFESQLKKQQARGGDYVADLPEHCVKETKGEKVVVVAGVLMIALQLAVAYISLSLSFRLPAKGD